MRLADLEWVTYSREGDKYSINDFGAGKVRIFDYAQANARAAGARYAVIEYYGVSRALMRTNSLLELSCWLADKEPL